MEVITLSSESEEDDSDVEIIAQYSNFLSQTDPLPQQDGKVCADAPNVNALVQNIDVTDSKRILADLKSPIKPDFNARPIVDLSDIDADFKIQNVCGSTTEQENVFQRNASADPPRPTLQRSSADPQTQIHTLTHEELFPFVTLTRLPFIEGHITEIKQVGCFVDSSRGCTLMSLQPRQDAAHERVFSDSERGGSAADTPAHSNRSTQASPTPTKEEALSGRLSERWSDQNHPAEDMSDVTLTETSVGDLEMEDPVCFYPKAWDFGEEEIAESTYPVDLYTDAKESRDFVCPVALNKLISGEDEALLMDISLDGEASEPPEELCHQTLTLVYSTIEENHTEGTLQLLSDLLQPGYYPPKNITFHLLHDVLLGPDCPYHLCVQAFHLLIRTQRHRPADRNTVPWDWDLLSSVMTEKEHPNKRKCGVVGMFMEYVARTLEDNFHTKDAFSPLRHSIAMATLSCDRQFHHVRDLLKWLNSAVRKSTGSEETARERDEHIRLVSIFQRMLSLALEVDGRPTLQSDKVSQELFLMLITGSFRREHRMLLLESLRSKRLRCKLLKHLLDYVCSVKTPLPASLGLLLHYMRNCDLLQEPTDGEERWRGWEELLHLLWMFLHSYNKTMKGYLSQSFVQERSYLGPFKKEDVVSKSHICEATKTLRARAEADLGQALPHHVEQSLHFLRDSLLDVCQG
ncbi:SUMO-interacting motif-containing protein 1 [Takifugu rubripes]|uniref:SUMO interacting motifs containing 1 n=1 Tax=Takifugu rubripes TaxID=31033 RepID=A0A3B5KB83_TAKRU|nr:SUMO-interacting motif-containing protein 1 [Takifugu rubripes]